MGRYSIIVVSTLIILLIIFVMSNNRLVNISVNRNISAFHANQARNIANSAAQIAVANIASGDWELTDENVPYYFPNNSNTFAPWLQLDGSYLVSGTRQGDLINLSSIGKSGNPGIEYEVLVALEIEQAGGGGLFNINPKLAVTSFGGITLEGSAAIMGDSGTYSTTANDVDFRWSTHIGGDFYTLQEADPYNVVYSVRGPGRQPEHVANSFTEKFPENPDTFPLPEFPDFPTSLTPRSDIQLTGVQTATINACGQYDRIRVTANCILNINLGGGDRVLRIRDFDIQQGHVILHGEGRLVLYVEDNFNLRGSSTINNLGATSAAHMFYSGSPAVNPDGATKYYGSLYAETADVIINGSGGIIGHIVTGGANVIVSGNAEANSRIVHAPNAHVSLTGSGRIRGAVICNSFSATGNTRVFFGEDDWDEESIEYIWGGSGSVDQVSVVSWR